MKRLLSTDPTNTTALIARLFLAIVVFPHGAQKLLGWFGGHGFNGTMDFLTGGAGLPWLVALFVILIEFFGPILLAFGLATRVAALGILGQFIGIVIKSHFYNGFFMNWGKQPNKSEGLEYFILLFALAIISLIAGGGKGSIDALISNSKTRKMTGY